MSNLILVIFVFLIGFGWGAAAMIIPIRNMMIKVLKAETRTMVLIRAVIEGAARTNGQLDKLESNCENVMTATKNVLDGVDKLLEEIGNEV